MINKQMTSKELYAQKFQAQMDEWHADIDKLRAKAAAKSADAQLEMNRKLDELSVKYSATNSKLAEFNRASEEAWEALKGGLEQARENLVAAFQEAKSKF